MNALFAAHTKRSWFFPSTSLQLSRANSLKFIQRFPSLSISSAVWQAMTCWNIAKLFGDLEVPFGLWVGADDELLVADRLVKCVRTATSTQPFKEIQIVPHASHMGNLIISTAYIVPFIRNFTRIIGPSLSFKLRRPSLEDFKLIQIIGRGSFGRVFLVQHRVSEKYFAMKVLDKSDVLDGMNFSHENNFILNIAISR
jgi:hypothetical protein